MSHGRFFDEARALKERFTALKLRAVELRAQYHQLMIDYDQARAERERLVREGNAHLASISRQQ